jgi:hypothetical protein
MSEAGVNADPVEVLFVHQRLSRNSGNEAKAGAYS